MSFSSPVNGQILVVCYCLYVSSQVVGQRQKIFDKIFALKLLAGSQIFANIWLFPLQSPARAQRFVKIYLFTLLSRTISRSFANMFLYPLQSMARSQSFASICLFPLKSLARSKRFANSSLYPLQLMARSQIFANICVFPLHCCIVVHINVIQHQNIFFSWMNRPSDHSSRRKIPVQFWELLYTFKQLFLND